MACNSLLMIIMLSSGLLQFDCQNVLSTGLLQVVAGLQMTSCHKQDWQEPHSDPRTSK